MNRVFLFVFFVFFSAICKCQNNYGKLTIEDVIDGYYFYYDYETNEYLSLENMYDELNQFDTIDRSHYHHSILVNFTMLNSGYDEPVQKSRFFRKTLLSSDTNYYALIERKYDDRGDFVKDDTVFISNRFYGISMRDSMYFHQDSIIPYGLYKLKSINMSNKEITEDFCNRDRFLTILPKGRFTQYFDGFNYECSDWTDYGNQNHGSSILSLSGKYHVSRDKHVYFISDDYGFIGRMKIKVNLDRIIKFENDENVEFTYEREK